MALSIRILGPFEVTAGAETVRLTGARRIGLLARLGLNAGRVVTSEQLLSDLWGESSATTAGKQLHIVVSKLRELLSPYHQGGLITTVAGGYRLDLAPDQVDAHLFVRLVRQAREQGDPDAASALFRRALALWRGPALAGVGGAWAEAESARLDEERLTAVEDHIDLRLAAGDPHWVVPELVAHIEAAPLRERPRAQLMLALYRSSRASEALTLYRDTRQLMVEELGIEPGPVLDRLHRAVLSRDPALDLGSAPRSRPGAALIPAELPADTRAFSGRTSELAWLHAALTGPASGPVVVSIDGPGGLGKSALAVRAAHSVADRFTDGVLYVDLRAATPGLRPMEPLEALGRMVRSLGLAGSAVPADLDEASARYRSLTAARTLLIVLDNALDARQVRHLLPAGCGCVVILTSRQALTSLDVTARLPLAVLTPDDGLALLSRVAGTHRVEAEPEAAAQIVRQCGGLPLALRIAAARLAARPDRNLSDLARRLADATRRLDALQHHDLAVRSSIAVGHAHLAADPATLFPLLSLLDVTTHTARGAAALTGWTEARADEAMEGLLEARLLESAGPGRYRLHDLVRLHAREQADQLPHDTRRSAVRQALLSYTATTDNVQIVLDPDGYTILGWPVELPEAAPMTWDEADAWIRAERDNLVSLAGQAVSEAPDVAMALADRILWVFWPRGWADQLRAVCESALEIAMHGDHWEPRARLHGNLGWLLDEQGRRAEAITHLERALACYDKARLPLRKAGTLNDLGVALTMAGDYDGALRAFADGLAITLETGRRDHQAMVLNNRVHAYHRLGRHQDAIDEARVGLAMWDDPRGPGAATAWDTLGDAYRAAGLPAEAENAYRAAVEVQTKHGMDLGNAQSCWWLGRILHDLGRHAEAREWRRQSLHLLVQAGLNTPDEAARLLEQDDPQPPAAIRNQL